MSVIPLDRVSKILSVVKAQQLLTGIDACRNNTAKDKSEEDNLRNDDFTKGFKIRLSSSGSANPVLVRFYTPVTVRATVEDASLHCSEIREGDMPVLCSYEWASAASAEELTPTAMIYQDSDWLAPFHQMKIMKGKHCEVQG